METKKNTTNAILEKRPPNAQALIVAEMNHDQTDIQTDYFSHCVTRRVLIGWRTTKRESFAQLRRAAANHPQTAHLGPGRDVWNVRAVWDHDQNDPIESQRAWLHNAPTYYKGWTDPHQRQSAGGYDWMTFETEAEADAWIANNPAKSGTEWQKNCHSVEHRENYTGGGGNFLMAGCGQHDSGWKIRSYSFSELHHYTIDENF